MSDGSAPAVASCGSTAATTMLTSRVPGDNSGAEPDAGGVQVAEQLQRMDSREILLDDKLFDSLPLDDLIRKSDPTHIDRLFLGHMKQELWKSVQPKEQVDKKPLLQQQQQQQQQKLEVFPSTPSTVASTTTSPRGRRRATRWGYITKGRGAAAAARKLAATRVNENSNTNNKGNTNTPKDVKEKREKSSSSTKEQVKDEEREVGETLVTENDVEPRQSSSVKAPINKGELSFVDGSEEPLPSEVTLQKKRNVVDVLDVSQPNANSDKDEGIIITTKDGDVQKIVSAVEAQFVKRFDAIERTIQTLGSDRPGVVGADEVKSICSSSEKKTKVNESDQVTPQNLKKITAAMEDHFAPRFDAIEGSLASIQHTLAALTTSLAKSQQLSPPPPPPPPPNHTLSTPKLQPMHNPPEKRGVSINKSPSLREVEVARLQDDSEKEKQRDDPGMHSILSPRANMQPAVYDRTIHHVESPLTGVSATPEEVANETKPKLTSSLQDVGSRQPKRISSQHRLTPKQQQIGSGKSAIECTRDELLTPLSPRRRLVASPYKAFENFDNRDSRKPDNKPPKDMGKSRKGTNNIISRAKKIMSKTNRAFFNPAETSSYSFVKKRNMKRSAEKDRTPSNASKDVMENTDDSLLSGAHLQREQLQKNDNNTGIDIPADTNLDIAFPTTASALRIRRLKYRPTHAPPIDEEVRDKSLLSHSQHDTTTKDNRVNSTDELIVGSATVARTSSVVSHRAQGQFNSLNRQQPSSHNRSTLISSQPNKSLYVSQDHPEEGKQNANTKKADEAKGLKLHREPLLNSLHMVQKQELPAYNKSSLKVEDHQANPDHPLALQRRRVQQSLKVGSRHKFEGTMEPQECQRTSNSAQDEKSTSWHIRTPVSLSENAGQKAKLWNESLDKRAEMSAIRGCNSGPLITGEGFGSAKIHHKSEALVLTPKTPTLKLSSPRNYEEEEGSVQQQEEVPRLALSSHPSDEEDELMATEISQEEQCSNGSRQGACDQRIDCNDNCKQVEIESHRHIENELRTGDIRACSAKSLLSWRSCLTDEKELSLQRNHVPGLPTTLNQTFSRESSRCPQDEARTELEFRINCPVDTMESLSDYQESFHLGNLLKSSSFPLPRSEVDDSNKECLLSPAVQSFPKYRESFQLLPLPKSTSFPLLPSKADNKTMECLQVMSSINDNEETEETEYDNDEQVRTSQDYASPPNSILATMSSSHHNQEVRQVLVPPPKSMKVNEEPKEDEEPMQSFKAEVQSTTTHPQEILVQIQDEYFMLSPGVSTVSNSISTTRSPIARDKQVSPTNQNCCSPSSTLDLLQAEDILQAILKNSAKKATQPKNAPKPEISKASAGSVVWSKPNHVTESACANETKNLMLPNLDALPPNNRAFAIIAQKIAEAEAALKAELARESGKPQSQLEDEDDVSLEDEEDEKKNMEILVPRTPHGQYDTPMRVVRPKNKGPTTTILTDNTNQYIELVHMNQAALFDTPLSPGMSTRSLNSTSSSDNEIAAKQPKASFLQRFQARNEKNADTGNTMRNRIKAKRLKRKKIMAVLKEQPVAQTPNGKPPVQPRKSQKQQKKPEDDERYAVPLTTSQSSSNESDNSSLSIGWALLDDIHENNAEHDAAQIFEIVERYYHYHHRYGAGNPAHFTVSLEERKKEPLDQLLSWTMAAFEEIERDFLTSFQDKGTEDQELDKTLLQINHKVLDMEEQEEDEEPTYDGDEEEHDDDDYRKRRMASTDDPLERLGIFDLNESNTNTNTNGSHTTSSFEDESTLFSEEDDTGTPGNNSISSDLYSQSR